MTTTKLRPVRASSGTAAATASKLLTPMTGRAQASARARAVARPMRTPVKPPGPRVTAIASSAG